MFNPNWKEDLKSYKHSKELEAIKKKEKDTEAMALIDQITSTFAKFKLEYEYSDLEDALEVFFKVCYGVEYKKSAFECNTIKIGNFNVMLHDDKVETAMEIKLLKVIGYRIVYWNFHDNTIEMY